MENNNLEHLKREYMNTPIPEQLDSAVKKAFKDSKKNIRKINALRLIRAIAASIAVAVTIFTAGVNTSPTFANALSEIPVVGNIVKVLTLKQYFIKENNIFADIKTPSIQGLGDKNLENSLNEKYLSENKKLYEEFMSRVGDLEKLGDAHLGIDTGYVVKTDTDRILSIGRYVLNIAGSSSTVFKYDTIDKKNQVLITLPSLFKDDSYVDIISENIKEQMLEQHKSNDYMTYWVEGIELGYTFDPFEKISPEQSFYINPENKLVISFDKYEVAPGYMGVIEFVIPTEILSDILVGDEYIK